MSNETERTLHELKLPEMASCWSSLEETHQLDRLTLREGMQIMLQYERDTRGNNRIQRLIKNAGFRLRASMEELETDTARGIQACSAADLATGNYITGGMTVIITDRQEPESPTSPAPWVTGLAGTAGRYCTSR